MSHLDRREFFIVVHRVRSQSKTKSSHAKVLSIPLSKTTHKVSMGMSLIATSNKFLSVYQDLIHLS